MNTNSVLLNCFGLALSIAKKQAWSGMAWKPGMEGGAPQQQQQQRDEFWVACLARDDVTCFYFYFFSVGWLKYYFNELDFLM